MLELLDSFINLMFGLCIGSALVCLLVLIVWIALSLVLACTEVTRRIMRLDYQRDEKPRTMTFDLKDRF